MSTLGALGIGSVVAAVITAIANYVVETNLATRIDRLLATASTTTDAAQRTYVMKEVTELKRKRLVRQRTRGALLGSLYLGIIGILMFLLGVVDGLIFAVLAGIVIVGMAIWLLTYRENQVKIETEKAEKEIT